MWFSVFVSAVRPCQSQQPCLRSVRADLSSSDSRPPSPLQMSNSCRLCLLVAAVCLMWPATVSAQLTFSEGWTHGKRDVSAQLQKLHQQQNHQQAELQQQQQAQQQQQLQQLLAAAAAATDGAPRPPVSLLDVLSKAAKQQAGGQQCKPDAEAMGLIYDLIMVSRA